MNNNPKYHISTDEMDSEQNLINQAQNDLSKFSKIYDRYYIEIFRFIFKRVESEQEAADLCSDTFLKAMQKLNSFEFRGIPFSSWLYKIALNEINQFYRKNKRTQVMYLTESDLNIICQSIDYQYSEKNFQVVISILEKLDLSDSRLIGLKYFEKKSYKEIGEMTGTSETNAKVKVFRIIQKMKAIVKNIKID